MALWPASMQQIGMLNFIFACLVIFFGENRIIIDVNILILLYMQIC